MASVVTLPEGQMEMLDGVYQKACGVKRDLADGHKSAMARIGKRILIELETLEAAVALDRAAYQQPTLVGDPAFCQAWLARYPFALHLVVTRALERVLGYLTVLPMTFDAIAEARHRGDDVHVPGDQVSVCDPGDRVYLYISSVVVRRDCSRRAVKEQLRASFACELRRLRERGVIVEAIVAVGYTSSGRKLLGDHGFQIATALEARLGPDAALLAGDRHLYEMTADARPRGPSGQLLRAAAFGA